MKNAFSTKTFKVSYSFYESICNVFKWNKSLANFILNYSWAQRSASAWSNCRWKLVEFWSTFKLCFVAYKLCVWDTDCIVDGRKSWDTQQHQMPEYLQLFWRCFNHFTFITSNIDWYPALIKHTIILLVMSSKYSSIAIFFRVGKLIILHMLMLIKT